MYVVLMAKRYSFYVTVLIIISRFIWFTITGKSPFADFTGTIFLGIIVLVVSQKAFRHLK